MITFTAGTHFSGGGYGVAFDSKHSTFDVTDSNAGEIVEVKEGTWGTVATLDANLGNYARIVVDPLAGIGFASGGNSGDVYAFNTSTFTLQYTLRTESSVQGMTLDTSRDLLIYINGSDGLSFFDYKTEASPYTLTLPAGGDRVAVDPVHQIVDVGALGSSEVELYNETTYAFIDNVDVYDSDLAILYDPLSNSVLTGSNAAGYVSQFNEQAPSPTTNVSVSTLSVVGDVCLVGDGSDEALVWGDGGLEVYGLNNYTAFQSVPHSTSFAYGIAEDPSTLTALAVDPSGGYDLPFTGTVVGSSGPNPPTGAAATPSNNSVSVSWTLSSTSGVTNYSVAYGPSPSSLTSVVSLGSASATSLTISGTDGIPVYAAVRDWVGAVPSSYTPVVTATPAGIPYPAEAITLAPGYSSLAVGWSSPASDDGSSLLNYSVGVGTSPSALSWTAQTHSGSSTTLTLHGLTGGTTYYVSVRAWNAIGGSLATLPVSGVPLASSPGTGVVITFTEGTSFSGGGYGVAFDARNGVFDVASSDGSTGAVTQVQEGTWATLNAVSFPLGWYCRIVVDASAGVGFVSGGNAGNVYSFNTSTLAAGYVLRTPGSSQGMALDTSRHLLIYLNGTELSFFNYQTLATPYSMSITGGTRVSVDPDHQIVALVEGNGVVALINETTHTIYNNISAPSLPIVYDPVSHSILVGTNGAPEVSQFNELAPSPVTNTTLTGISTVQDLALVGGGSDEALVWGTGGLVVYGLNNATAFQYLGYGTSFPYGIAEDPTTLVALAVDQPGGYDLPFYGAVVGTTGPSPPTALVATPQNGSVTFSWTLSSTTGVTNYSIGYGASPAALTNKVSLNSATATSYQVNGPDGTAIFARVQAWVGASPSPVSLLASAAPGSAPYPVQDVRATPGNGSLTVAWAAPLSDDGYAVINYSVGIGSSPSSLSWVDETGSGSLFALPVYGLVNGATEFYSVRAWNALGGSLASTPRSAVPTGVPYPVGRITVTAANDSLQVSWNAPSSDGGTAVLQYRVNYSLAPSGPFSSLWTTAGPSGGSATVWGLTDATPYYVEVSARNAVGNGSASSSVVGIPVGVPYPPAGISATLISSSSAAVSWLPPVSVDGSSLTDYLVSYRTGTSGTIQTVTLGPTTLAFDLSDLASGTTYEFRVAAVNGAGTGNSTSWVKVTTPSSTSTNSLLSFFTSITGIVLILAIIILAIVVAVLLAGRRRRTGGSAEAGENAAAPGAPPPAPFYGSPPPNQGPPLGPPMYAPMPTAGGGPDALSSVYGSYPLGALDAASQLAPTPPQSVPPEAQEPWALDIAPEGIQVVELPRPSNGLAPSGAPPSSPAPGLPSATPASESPPVVGDDADGLLEDLFGGSRSIDQLRASSGLDDEQLFPLLGALVKARMIARSTQERGNFELTQAGGLYVRRHLNPGGAPTLPAPVVAPATAPPPGAAPAPPGGAPSSPLPAGQAVVLQLVQFHGYVGETVVPPGVTQAGLAQALRTTPNSVAVTLERLRQNGLVVVDLRHVQGGRRRLKAYFLTERGLSFAQQLRRSNPNG